MSQGKTKVYIYTRVSTTMQIDGYSLDAQKARMKAYADFNDYQIVGEYEDAGKSGKSIEGRASFCRMMEDIKSGKDGVSLRFGVQTVSVRPQCRRCVVYLAGHAGFRGQPHLRGRWH